jgi:hypothetical protein
MFIYYLLYPLGVFFCLMNFYLSFLRVPLLKGKGVPPDRIRHVSGAPMLGTVFVLLGTAALSDVPGIVPIGVVLILLDTGGPHWFVGTMLFMAVRGRRPHA